MNSTDAVGTALRRVLTPRGRSNDLLRLGLGGLAAIVVLLALFDLVRGLPWGVDLVIPLKAAERWLAGGRAYLPESFASGPGEDLPFLYPPYSLPIFAPLTAVPREVAIVTWFVASLAAAIWSLRSLRVTWGWIPLVLAWPPFAEGLIVGNVQIAIFAAFLAVFAAGPDEDSAVHRRGWHRPVGRGFVGAATAFLKVAQVHAIVHLIRWDRRSATVALVGIASLVLLTLPLTGTALWFEWTEQVRRAADPDWALGGPSLSRYVPTPVGPLVVLGTLAAVLAVPRGGAAPWVGVLAVIGAPSLHVYTLLFLLPAMLKIRRELALIAALLISTYREPGWWLAIAIVAGALALSRLRAGLLEPGARTRTAGEERSRRA